MAQTTRPSNHKYGVEKVAYLCHLPWRRTTPPNAGKGAGVLRTRVDRSPTNTIDTSCRDTLHCFTPVFVQLGGNSRRLVQLFMAGERRVAAGSLAYRVRPLTRHDVAPLQLAARSDDT
ncbi:Hypp437 [Branchiostoma lanceolatum]|uniref:Hypp437 protein n=1 Tax=Branchiostoma lanceolatum TaxID=7740 RepID=A0A8J9V9Q0_BRALA|nr:Hypp437 [Branchiostoma lanceolatum]